MLEVRRVLSVTVLAVSVSTGGVFFAQTQDGRRPAGAVVMEPNDAAGSRAGGGEERDQRHRAA